MKFFTVFMVFLFLLCCVVTIAAATNPRYTSDYYVDTIGIVGDHTSIAMNVSYHPCISYHNTTGQSLKYAEQTGVSWALSTVDSGGDVGYYTSLALDSSGYPHISYYDNTNHDLKYARWMGSAWAISTVDSGGDVGKTTSLALDEWGNPWISYYDKTNTSLKCAYRYGTPWIIHTVDDAGDVGSYTSLALDVNNRPHISYYDETNTALKYARWTGSTWVHGTVDNTGEVGTYSSLALDGSGYPHISYYDNTGHDLKFAEYTGSMWIISTVDTVGDVGTDTSLALDGGNPWISYYDVTHASLKCATKTGATWIISIVDSDPLGVGTYSSLALDGTNLPQISYYCESGSLKYLHKIHNIYDIGTFRNSTHMFYLDYNGNGVWDGAVVDRAYDFGLTGDIPVPGEWDNIGRSYIGVFRPSTHMFYLDWNRNGRWDGAVTDRAYDFGLTGDIPVSGFWDADRLAKIGTYRPSTHMFYLDYNGNGRWDGVVTDRAYDFGLTGDIPVVGDWNDNGMTKIGVYRSSTHMFYLDYNGNGRWDGVVTDRAYNFGLTGDIPVSGDWGWGAPTEIGVFRPSSHTFYLDWNRNGRWDGAVTDKQYNYGLTGDSPVSGNW